MKKPNSDIYDGVKESGSTVARNWELGCFSWSPI